MQPMTFQARRWVLNVGLGYVDLAVSGIVFLVMTPLLVSRLGAGAYAVWVLGHTIAAYLRMFDLGIGDTHVRYFARYAAGGRSKALRDLTATVTVLLTVAAIAALIAGTVVAFGPRDWWEDIAETLRFDLQAVILLLACQVFVAVPSAALDDIYEGLQRFDVQAARSVVLRIVSGGAQLALLLSGFGVVALVAVGLAATSVAVLVDLAIFSRLRPEVLRLELKFHRPAWNRIRRFALWSSADDLVAEAGSYIDDLMLVALLPFKLLTPYSVASTITTAMNFVAEPITATFYPLAATLQARRAHAGLAKLVLRGTQAVAGIAAPLGIVAAVFGVDIARAWVPDAVEGTSVALFAALAASAFVSAYLWTGWIVLAATGSIRTVVKLLIVEVIVEIGLTLLLVPRFGLMGLALADFGGNALVGVFLELPLVARLIGLRAPAFIWRTLGRLSVPILTAATVAFLLRRHGLGDTPLELLLAAITVGLAYVAVLLIGSSRDERDDFRVMWRQVRDPETAFESPVARNVS
jgi:O-antigen/teichoic acid export membrane protein